MGLEEIVFASVEIRNFLRLFSEHQWNKVCKATLLLGINRIQELMERCGDKGLTHLSLDALDELVIAAHLKAKKRIKKDRHRHNHSERDNAAVMETTQEEP